MSFSRIKLLFVAAALILAACQPEILTPGPLPTPEVWQIEYTPAVAWLAPEFQKCAAEQPGANLVVNETVPQSIGSTQADFAFQWGETSNPPAFAAVIGQDQLAVVVNPQNPVLALGRQEIIGLFDGKVTSWGQVIQSNCASCGSDFEGEVKAYVYATDNEVQRAAGWIHPGGDAILAPDPAAVLQAVAAERYSIGYLPARWVDATVKQVEIDGAQAGDLTQPLLAMAPAEPQGAKRAWLLCLQEQLK